MVLLAYVSPSCRQARTCTEDNDVFSVGLKFRTKAFIHSFIPNIHSAMFLSLSRDITVVARPETKLKLSHSVAWFTGVIWATSHILYSSLRVCWVHLLFSFLFCRRTWLTGIISSAIFTRLERAQPQSKFSDRFTEGSTPTLSHRHADKDALGNKKNQHARND